MGCAFTKVCSKSDEEKAIQKIFDFMTSDEELTEPSLIAIAERMKRISLAELKMSKILLDDRIKNVSESNAVDLLLVSITTTLFCRSSAITLAISLRTVVFPIPGHPVNKRDCSLSMRSLTMATVPNTALPTRHVSPMTSF